MGPSNPADTSAPTPTYRQWVGVLLSLLIAGAGIFLAGNRKAGLRWFLGLTALKLATVALASLPAIPGLEICVALASVTTALTLWMLVLSFKPVPRLGVRGWLLFLLLAGLLSGFEVLGTHRLTQAFKVPTTRSMGPTILPGDHLFVQTSAYWLTAPSRGDVVAFRTDGLDSSLVPKGQIHLKRIAGLPGESLQISEGRLLINGRPLDKPALLAGRDFATFAMSSSGMGSNVCRIPENSCFVVGDNTTNSLDSRFFGPIPRASIIGRATKIYWPLARAGDIR
jgi:signal peptidase I